jgi:energy-coupling factor transport system substrate-specific component
MTVSSRRLPAPQPTTVIVTLVPAAAALNVVGGYLNGVLGLPTFLDMIGTCVAAIVLGPWWGALAGALSNVVGALFYGPSNIPFALVNVVGALVWGYGVRRFGMGRTATRYFVLNVLVALAASGAARWTGRPWSQWATRASGLAFVGLGVRLAWRR